MARQVTAHSLRVTSANAFRTPKASANPVSCRARPPEDSSRRALSAGLRGHPRLPLRVRMGNELAIDGSDEVARHRCFSRFVDGSQGRSGAVLVWM
jgi:hypothetical protein